MMCARKAHLPLDGKFSRDAKTQSCSKSKAQVLALLLNSSKLNRRAKQETRDPFAEMLLEVLDEKIWAYRHCKQRSSDIIMEDENENSRAPFS